MTVYVDDVRHNFGRMVMCHMWADTLDELHAMADRIGIARRWFQTPPKASWNHYDISLSKKAEAMAAGAILTDRYGPLDFTAGLLIASGRPELVARGHAKREMVAECRARDIDAWMATGLTRAERTG